MPGPASPSSPSTPQGEPLRGEEYRRLLKCLAVEQWKAGGCFQDFLERQGADTEVGGWEVRGRWVGVVCGEVRGSVGGVMCGEVRGSVGGSGGWGGEGQCGWE